MFAELLGIGGSKPKVPAFVPLDLAQEQRKSIAGNLGALPEAKKLAVEVNAFNQSQLNTYLEEALPGIRAGVAESLDTVAQQRKGLLSKDTQDFLQNQTVARSLSGGYGGSGANDFAIARNLGLSSFEIQQRGMDNTMEWIRAGKSYLMAPQHDVSSAFVTPMQQAQFDVNERNSKWNVDWLKAQQDAAPAPWQRALGGILDFGVGAVAGGFLGKVGRNMAGDIGSGLFAGGGSDFSGYGDTGEMPYSGNLSNPFDFEAQGFGGGDDSSDFFKRYG